MLVIIKSAPDTQEAKRGIKLARDMAADICLIQNAVYFAQIERLEGFCGTAYAVKEDLQLRGLQEDDIERELKIIGWDELIDMMTGEDKTIGAF
ncbi:hypothetical protein MNBD_NITROSPIRAE03-1451 [hydrothermal vent metagenome]|uniref:tRNA 5-methylaminomethyl-2-thiouridine synthase subunit TusB n=1 Tax=hydrothermal vent metagenome TaxID=652676 RepID=A0A3B1D222_9ZZZZ